MTTTDPKYDDPEIEQRWCDEQRKRIGDYLHSQNLKHGQIGKWPAWRVAPYASIWAIESLARPGWIGWWAICGDLPTDCISSADVEPPQHPRKAMRVFAQNWLDLVEAWREGRDRESSRIGDSSSRKTLGPLLESRATLLMEWAVNDSLWEEQ